MPREMVLNHASIFAPDTADVDMFDWLVGIARGMAALVDAAVAEKALRMCLDMSNVWCRPGFSLFDACQSLRPQDRDAYLFLMTLSQKVPITQGIVSETKDRLLACESLHPSAADGEPLLLCAISDWIAVGFPSSLDWDRDRVHLVFQQLQPDGELETAEDDIDNLTRCSHADAILRRERERRGAGTTVEEVWAGRGQSFPGLLFGPEVERHLKAHARLLPQIVGKLIALEESARTWTEGPAPHWRTKVTPESDMVMDNPKLRDARLFESLSGKRELFEWHARIGSGFRIHLRFEANQHSVEIGYMGPKLPT